MNVCEKCGKFIIDLTNKNKCTCNSTIATNKTDDYKSSIEERGMYVDAIKQQTVKQVVAVLKRDFETKVINRLPVTIEKSSWKIENNKAYWTETTVDSICSHILKEFGVKE